MKDTDQLIKTVAANVKKAQAGEVFFEEIFSKPDLPKGKNEFLFFVKPEITLPLKSIQLEKILEIIFSKLSSYDLTVSSVKILSARYLDQYNIIAQHYGVINQIASNAVEHMSESAKTRFRELYGVAAEGARVLGGIEFLKKYPAFDAYTLGDLWQDSSFEKLAGGTYCVKIMPEGETVYLINGFHPKQLKHFVEDNRSIVVMTLSGDTSWRVARNDLIGATMPAKAVKDSLRRLFLDNQDELGLSDVSPSINGVHLSAGPVEALVELRRYNSDFSHPSGTKIWSDFSFGKNLLEVFTHEVVEQITDNVNLQINGKTISVFDLTEEMDSDEALKVLAEHFPARKSQR